MCRLFAYVAPDPESAAAELGEQGLAALERLARLHGDGWGWSGVASAGDLPMTHKSWRSASADPGFRTTLSTRAHAGMVHLRWATPGIPVEQCNAHPFQVGDLAFEHNGSIRPKERLRALVADAMLDDVDGATDSELYFALIRAELAHGRDLADTVRVVVARLRTEFPEASFNAMLLDPEYLVVVHASARTELLDSDAEEIAAMRGFPPEHLTSYFSLRWTRHDDGAILVGSTGVAEPDWMPLPPESVTEIRIADGTTRTLEVGLADVGRVRP
jgi:glutamine amidotransferase